MTAQLSKIEPPSGKPFKIVGTQQARRVAVAAFGHAGEEGRAAIFDLVADRDHQYAQNTKLQHVNTGLVNLARHHEAGVRGTLAAASGRAESDNPYRHDEPGYDVWREHFRDADDAIQARITAARDTVMIDVFNDRTHYSAQLSRPHGGTILACEHGASQAEAVGMLVMAHARTFGMSVFRAEPAEPANQRIPILITMIQRQDAWHAQIDSRRWEDGRTCDGALAHLITARAAELGLKVIFQSKTP